MKTILIIGAGLGGLALAQLLQQEFPSSVKVIIFERDAGEDFRDQGYFLTINSTGIDVLKRITTVNDLFSSSSTMSYDQYQRILVGKSMNILHQLGVGEMKIIERAALRRSLLKNIDVQWNKRFVSYKVHHDGVEAYFEDGSVVHGALLIGCDGGKSLVRAQLIPDFQIDDVGIIRVAGTLEQNEALVQIKKFLSDSFVQVVGDRGHSLLLLATADLWFWALSWPSANAKETEISRTQIVDKVRTNFNNEELVRLVELSSFVRHHVLRILSSALVEVNPYPNNPRVTLLGDAAHLMTPHRGLGANTTFADALDFVNVVRHDFTSSALADYEENLFKHGFQAVRDSLQITRMLHTVDCQVKYIKDT